MVSQSWWLRSARVNGTSFLCFCDPGLLSFSTLAVFACWGLCVFAVRDGSLKDSLSD
jgi:hypothetical protein